MPKANNEKKIGVYEWVSKSVNLYKGCQNNCSYCYARNFAVRFKQKTKENWPIMVFNQANFKKRKIKTYPLGYMCFSSHDIFPFNMKILTKYVIDNILETSDNDVLIVSKPRLEVIEYMCKELKSYIDRIEFRFSITTLDDKIRQKYEKDASSIQERINCLKYAYLKNFKTSVSIEPFLDKDPIPLIREIAPYSKSIWLGCMRGYKYEFYTKDNLLYIIREVKNLNKELNPSRLLKSSNGIKIKFKESFVKKAKQLKIEMT